jgi:hypothetical protein
MPDYLFFKNPAYCPACRRKTQPSHFRPCRNCGTLLFLRPIDFPLWEAEGNLRVYWCFHPHKGWLYRDWFFQKDEPKPIERIYVPPKLPDNYGRTTTPEAVARRGLKTKHWKKLLSPA